MTIDRCSDAIIHDIDHEMFLHNNKSLYPISIGYHVGHGWLVSLEVNSPNGTFDIESEDERRDVALARALKRLRASFSEPTKT